MSSLLYHFNYSTLWGPVVTMGRVVYTTLLPDRLPWKAIPQLWIEDSTLFLRGILVAARYKKGILVINSVNCLFQAEQHSNAAAVVLQFPVRLRALYTYSPAVLTFPMDSQLLYYQSLFHLSRLTPEKLMQWNIHTTNILKMLPFFTHKNILKTVKQHFSDWSYIREFPYLVLVFIR